MVVALKAASLQVRPGEVHGLMGSNGAGKSTLVKIITGVFPADGGQIFVKGVARSFRSPAQARSAGIVSVYQDPALVPDSPVHGPGWRFFSLQVFDVRGLYARIIAGGGREGIAPKRLGDVARYAFVRDPDGTWIELSQRASLTGPLGDD